jgi:hypothetical protein
MDDKVMAAHMLVAWQVFEASMEAVKHLKMVPFTLSVMTDNGAAVIPFPGDPAEDRPATKALLTTLQTQFGAVFFVHEAWSVKPRTPGEAAVCEALGRLPASQHPLRRDALVGSLYFESGHAILFSCEIKTNDDGTREPLIAEAMGCPGVTGEMVPALTERMNPTEM